MTQKSIQNIPASVRQRLNEMSHNKEMPFELLALHYSMERFLYRLSKSSYADRFILKGAMLFALWKRLPQRVTRDLDMLVFGENDEKTIQTIIQSVCNQQVIDDGLSFHESSIRITPIREIDAYNGFRIRLKVNLDKMVISMQIDLGFGDAVTPGAQIIHYPGLLDFPQAKVRAYPPESVVAEKTQAIVSLGMANSRMKDYYDLYMILNQFDLHPDVLAAAMAATFSRRRTDIPIQVPIGLSDEFSKDSEKQKQWQQFLNRQQLDSFELELSDVVDTLKKKLIPAMEMAKNI